MIDQAKLERRVMNMVGFRRVAAAELFNQAVTEPQRRQLELALANLVAAGDLEYSPLRGGGCVVPAWKAVTNGQA